MNKRNYMSEVGDLIELVVKEGEGDDIVRAILMRKASVIKDLSEYVTQFPIQLSDRTIELRDKACNFLEQRDAKNIDRALEAFRQMIYKVATAPTSLHMEGAVYLNLPIINKYLELAVNEH